MKGPPLTAVKPAPAKGATGKTAATKAPKRTRSRATHEPGAPAAWFSQEARRPSSFIPAPPRAEAPSLVAAPPASSDRLIHPSHLEDQSPGVRTIPVRIDVEQGAGRFFIGSNPERLVLKAGEGIEWDFRYVGGADALVEEIIIEFDKPGPFARSSFRSTKPGSARPHRQMSGAAQKSTAGKEFGYRIRCLNIIKRDVALGHALVMIIE
ncbi:MAG: hypothetical protein ABI718_01200 [Acidobacteriota bacterium]